MTELFIEKSKLIHGDKYDYFKVDYIKSKVNVIITCKVHGDFLQTPNNHLRGANCNKCGVITNSEKKKITSHEFIKRCNEIHGDRYDYTKVDYIDANTKVIIICKEHGEFYKTPSKHTNAKQGCAKCSGYYIPTTDEFIENARLVHGDIYEYSKVDYKYSNENVIITCKIHGDFLQRPSNHIKSKQGCPKCGGSCKSNTIEFIEKSIKIHSDIYDYSKVNYIDATTKIIISCKIHGDFEQKPYSHLNGHGCYMCCKNSKLNTIEFIEKAKLIHGDKYDYSKVDYKYCDIPVIIVCKIHGEFMKTPIAHYNSCRGCPKCSNNGYSKPSILWLDFLSKLYNINIQHACNDGEYVITTTKYKADGFCKENNTIYEFHGDYWHGNPKVFNLDDFNEITKCTYKDLYDNTLIRENKIKDLGYNLVVIWENDWKKINKCVKILQQRFRKYNY